MKSRIKLIQALACCLFVIACQTRSYPLYPVPPGTSYRTESLVIKRGDTSQSVRGAFVTAEFIKATRAQPQLGRYFVDEDEYQPKHGQVIVVSHELWQKAYGSDPAVIGAMVSVNDTAYTVVGVMPEGFRIPDGSDLWLPETAPVR